MEKLFKVISSGRVSQWKRHGFRFIRHYDVTVLDTVTGKNYTVGLFKNDLKKYPEGAMLSYNEIGFPLDDGDLL